MYIGLGQAARNPGFRPRTIRVPAPHVFVRRGMRGLGLTCPSNQQPTNMYDGSVQCCGVPGTACAADPCCILNNPGFIAAQNNQIAQDIATAGPLEQPTLQALTSVPVDVGDAAVFCESNPGATYTAPTGRVFNCPSPSHTDITTGGQPMSTYSEAALAQMLNTPGSGPVLAGNLPFAIQTNPGPGIVAPKPTPSGTPASPPAPSGSTPAVPAAAGSTPTVPTTDIGSQVSSALSSNVSVAGVNLPLWGLAAAGLALFFFMGKR